MESEKVKEIKNCLECWQESVMLSTDENYVSHRVTNREILDYINELESENERLMKLQARGGCRVAELGIENQQLKDRIVELEKRCHFIWALGYDYDGCEKAESLKSLIDELVAISQGNWGDVCSKCENKQDNLIKEQLKQFAERLKEKLKARHEVDRLLLMPVRDVVLSTIEGLLEDVDKTLKELINE